MGKIATWQRMAYRALEDFRVEHQGGHAFVRAGELFDSEHEIPLAYPDRFELIELKYTVEQATAAPGERRWR